MEKFRFRVRQFFAMTVVRLVGSTIQFLASNVLFVQQDFSIPSNMRRRAHRVLQDRFAYRAQKNLKNVSLEHILKTQDRVNAYHARSALTVQTRTLPHLPRAQQEHIVAQQG